MISTDNSNTAIRQALSQRVLCLDGAMGTMIQTYDLREEDYRGLRGTHPSERFADLPGQQAGNNDLLCITQPEVISDIHRRYIAAGADIIETNTFNAQRISLQDYHCEDLVREINLNAARIARAAADAEKQRTIFVVGSIGPTNKSLSMSPDVENPALRALTFDELADAYVEQMTALIEGGVDALLIETIFDTLNAKAAIYAAEEAMQKVGHRVEIMLSVTVNDRAGRTLSGQTLDAFLASVSHAPLLSVGLNCSFGARDMLEPLRQIASRAPYYISVYPNAGLPNQMGKYDETPESMQRDIKTFLDERLANIVGGCCGTTDAHIAAIAELTRTAEPHSPAPSPQYMWLAGLERLELSPEVAFINVGERCNVAGSRKFLRLIQEKNYEEALSIARQQVEDGALVLDINMDDGLLDAKQEMTTFLNLIAAEPDICRVPLMIDSSKWDVISCALRLVQGKAIVNSISLKEGEDIFLAHAREIRRLGAAVVVMAFDEQGQATTLERRIKVCERSYRLLTEQAGFNPLDIIFDPNVLTIATGMPEHDRYALDFINTAAWIRKNLPGAHISGGVSNLSFAFRGNNYLREAMHAVFLYYARQAGMDFAIVNPSTKVTYADIPADLLERIEDAVLARRTDASERLTEFASLISQPSTLNPPLDPSGRLILQEPSTLGEPSTLNPQPTSLSDRLISALRRGDTSHLEADLMEALHTYPRAVDIIEGPLMDGMNLVGQLFGEGKMFLPQVIKTARTMKQAVEILRPHLSTGTSNQNSTNAPRILLATVKGDVHDIGKNIVGVVMACNGYEVIDLGVMVPAEEIVRKALELKPDVIGLSGLITPSLEEMVHTVHALAEAGVNVPIMIGGATTSNLHTALKIAPVYEGAVIHVRDASQNAPLASRFLNPSTVAQATAELAAQQEELRHKSDSNSQQISSFAEAQAKKPKYF